MFITQGDGLVSSENIPIFSRECFHIKQPFKAHLTPDGVPQVQSKYPMDCFYGNRQCVDQSKDGWDEGEDDCNNQEYEDRNWIADTVHVFVLAEDCLQKIRMNVSVFKKNL